MIPGPAISSAPRRISIDAFRAITLLLMIFVNDHGSLRDIPSWLGHTEAAEDAMGFADVIFPAFLFIAGLSIPYAIQNRLKKGEAVASVAAHIILRSAALLLMGLCHVNLGNYSADALISRPVWEVLITIAFFLIWLDYPKVPGKRYPLYLRATGIVLLIALLAIYRGKVNDQVVWMQPKWWGILGLIGWTYFICGLIFLFSRGKLSVQMAALVFFIFFNSATQLGWLSFLNPLRQFFWIVGDGSMPALTTAGIVTSLVYTRQTSSSKNFWLFILFAAVLMFAYGFLTRPLWGISKIRATPSWVTICTGISMISFGILVFITEIRGLKSWYNVIKAAGTSTLTCYLIPYLYEAGAELTGAHLPVELRTGIIGLSKSFLLSLCIIWIVALLEKKRIRLKL